MSINSVLITGANRGLGLEFVKQFLALSTPPHFIFAVCRDPDKAYDLQELAKSHLHISIIKLDMKDSSAYPSVFRQILDKSGETGLNLLINNAGIVLRDTLEEVTREHMLENYEVNVVSPLMFAKELLPLLKKAASKSSGSALSCSRAAIVNITSKMGSISDNSSGTHYPYRASKAALNMVTRSLSVDLKPYGILALAVHPGWVQTAMGGDGALLNTQTSVGGMMNVILKASEEDSGFMFNYDGKKPSQEANRVTYLTTNVTFRKPTAAFIQFFLREGIIVYVKEAKFPHTSVIDPKIRGEASLLVKLGKVKKNLTSVLSS